MSRMRGQNGGLDEGLATATNDRWPLTGLITTADRPAGGAGRRRLPARR